MDIVAARAPLSDAAAPTRLVTPRTQPPGQAPRARTEDPSMDALLNSWSAAMMEYIEAYERLGPAAEAAAQRFSGAAMY